MNLTAQILGLIGVTLDIIGIQLKKKKNILIAFFLANVIFSISFVLLKSYSGAVICLVAATQTIVKYLYENKNKKFPIYLAVLYIIVALISGAWTYKTYIDVLPVMCSISYTLSILQKKERNLRIIILFNVMLWVAYDFYVGLYTVAINDVGLTISTLIAIIRYDIMKSRKLVKKLERFVTEGLSCFIEESKLIELDNGKLIYNEMIEDIYWNYIYDIKAKNKDGFELTWQKNRKYMIDRNRIPSFYLLPLSIIKEKHIPEYMKLESNEIWMVLDSFKNIDDIPDAKIEIKIDNNPDIKDFIKAFMKSYSSSSEEDPYGELPKYYIDVLEKAKKYETEYKKYFYVVYVDNKPVSTAISVENNNISLICFVGTIPEYRHNGICKHLMKYMLKEIKDRKIKTVFLQTEDGFVPEKIYSSLGFKTRCKAKIFIEKEG